MKKPKIPLKIIAFCTMGTLLLVMALGIFFKMFVNHRFVSAYDRGEYLTDNEEMLMVLNAPESYLPYYNMGNVAFENTDYNSAVGYYTKALSLMPLGQKECDVRINLALSMCYSIDFQHLETQERIDTALIILYKARDILLENGWANEDPELAKDADAQQLKEDIDDLIEQLEEPQEGEEQKEQPQQDDPEQDQSGSEDQTPSGSDKEKRQQDQLDKNKKNAMEERQRQQSDLEKWGSQDEEAEEGGVGAGGQYKPW